MFSEQQFVFYRFPRLKKRGSIEAVFAFERLTLFPKVSTFEKTWLD